VRGGAVPYRCRRGRARVGVDVIYLFAGCELDTDTYELRRNGDVVSIEPQVYDVLVYLLERRDRVVAKEELLDDVWKTRFVTESTLTTRIKNLRRAVGDDGRLQRIVRTVHGRGYRFVADVDRRGGPAGEDPAAVTALGREAQQEVLARCMADVATGQGRRVVVVSGEPGVGKTLLVDAMAAHWRSSGLRLLTGQCVEYRGAGEPYLPLLEALAEAAMQPYGPALVELLSDRAPTWLVQMPWLVADDEFDGLRRRVVGSTRDRMLREIVEALEALAAVEPVVLILEDLQWSDPSTVDVLAALGRRRTAARLLVVLTCRNEELAGTTSGLLDVLHDLRLHGALTEVQMPPLGEGAAAELVGRRCGAKPSDELMGVANRRAAGNPLHLQSLVDEWLELGLIAVDGDACVPTADAGELAATVPGTLRQLIEQRLARAPAADRELLEAAAIAGRQFSAAATAAALGIDPEDSEARCSQLAHRSLLVTAAGEHTWSDGTVTAVFRFDHDLYQEVVYGRVPPQRRARLHLQIGRRLEDGYGAAAPEHATELAMHFIRGRDATRAATHVAHAAQHAIGRNAHVEALEHVRVGLDLVAAMDEGPGRQEHELVLQTILGPLLIATRGWASPEVEAAYERAHELARRSADPARALPPILYGLGSLYESRGEYRRAAEVLQQVLDLEDTGHAAHHMGSHELLACSLFHQGKFDRATTHAETGWELYDPDQHLELQARYGYNPGVGCLTWGALSLWYLGETERASALMADAFALAQDADHAYSLASAHEQAAILHQLRDEPAVTLDHAAAALEMARARGFAHQVAIAQVLWGWSRATMGGTAEGLDELRAGIEAYRATGARMDLPYFLGLLADALLRAGRIDEGMAAIDEALAESGDRDYCHAAELHRLRALLLAQRGAADEDVAAELVRARDIARRQGAPVLEERASLALDEIVPAVASTESAG
jgi:DNA-binding winged helix-turn-helix (wHTH) protein/predicted ATPase